MCMDLDKHFTTELKVSLLSNGINFEIDLFENMASKFYDNQFVYGQTSKNAGPRYRFPQVLVLNHGVITALLRRENSPWNLKFEANTLQLYHKTQQITNVNLPERPPYFDKFLNDGTPTENIIAVAGEDTPGFFFYPDCYYFDDGTACGFCSLKGTRNTVGKHMTSDFKEQNIVEATKTFQTTKWRNIPLISITAGTCRTDEETKEHIITPINIMHDALDEKIPIHVLAHPPHDFKLIDAYKKAGVTSIAFNLEIYSRDIFNSTCVGKQQYGYDKWWDALNYAKDIFGGNNVYCGLVWGLEPPESTMKGNEYILSQGIGLASNIFHADPKSLFRNKAHPTEQAIMQIAKHESKLYIEHPNVRTIFSVSMRSTIDWEINRGYLK